MEIPYHTEATVGSLPVANLVKLNK
jgi:hypothetical protein